MGGRTLVGFWVNHAKSGELVFRNEEWREAVFVFADEEPVLHTYYGGKGVGTIVEKLTTGLEGSMHIIDGDVGDIMTVDDVMATKGMDALSDKEE
jgi:hypothetical protein